jgi:cytosine/adenosine deaminase-related metal-dependent hydrolase
MSGALFKNCRYLITQADPTDGILERGAVYVEGPVIRAVGPTAELEKRFATGGPIDIVDCAEKIVMPGLVDSHNHVGEYHQFLILGMSAWQPVRGILDVLHHYIWPAWAWLTPESSYDLTLLGLMNMLKHGTTTTANAFHFPDAVYRAAEHARMRMVIQPQIVSSYRLADGLDGPGYLAETERAIREYHRALDGLITVEAHASWPWNTQRSVLVKAMELAAKYDVQFATHLFEAPDEKRLANQLCADVGGAIPYLEKIGLINERSVFFHCTQLDEQQIELMARAGAGIVHCPTNNARKGDCANVPYMLKAGVRVGLGTDNPTGNLFKDMAAVHLFHNIMPREHRGGPVWLPLDLATRGSARVLRMEDRIGTLEAGKRADIITIDLRRNTDLMPLNTGMLYYFLCINGPGAEVDEAMVDGVFLRRDGKFTIFDEERILARGKEWFAAFTEYYEAGQRERRTLVDLVYEEFSPAIRE